MIETFDNAYGGNPFQLERFLKKIRVETTHLPVRKNKKGEKIPRIKTIIALANTNDGHGMEHPPQVDNFAAGPRNVKFWLDPTALNTSTISGEKKDKQAAKRPAGYVTVYDFFKNSNQTPPSLQR